MYSLEELLQALHNSLALSATLTLVLTTHSSKTTYSKVVIDSRIKTVNGIFVAIKGESHDGHSFAKQSIENGAGVVIVSRQLSEIPLSKQIIVKNTLQALGQIAAFNRKRCKNSTLIAITGSCGKTSTKEIIAASLEKSAPGKVAVTDGNYNNHIGMPLCLANASTSSEFIVMEMGMNSPGEIDYLSKIAQPDIAIITNIGYAHLNLFKSRDGIADAKCEIMNGLRLPGGCVIFNANNEYFEYLINKAKALGIAKIYSVQDSSQKVYTTTHNVQSLVEVNKICVDAFCAKFNVLLKSSNVEIKDVELPIPAQHIAFNSLFAFAVSEILKTNPHNVKEKLLHLKSSDNRTTIQDITVDGKKILLIKDHYNSSPEAVYAILETANNIRNNRNLNNILFVIGDMRELGEKSAELHLSILPKIEDCKVDKIIAVGPHSATLFNALKKEKQIYSAQNSSDKNLLNECLQAINNNDVLIFKASNGTHLDILVNKFENYVKQNP